jgi:hypothetical protein
VKDLILISSPQDEFSPSAGSRTPINQQIMQTKTTKLSLLCSALLCSQMHAAFPLVCNTLEATTLSQVTLITSSPQGDVYKYRLRASVRNVLATTAMGFEIKAPTLESLTTTHSFSSGPIMARKGMPDTFITISESGVPAPGTSFSPDNNGAVDITSSSFADTIVFSFCQPYQSSDLVFIAKAGRTYKTTRSQDLSSWEIVERISPNVDTEIWRPQFMLQSMPAPLNELALRRRGMTEMNNSDQQTP